MYDTDEVLREILWPSTMTSTSTDGTPSAVDNLQDGGFLADLLAENTMNDVGGSSPAWITSTTWTTLATLSTSSGVGDASGVGADPATDRASAGGAEDDGGELDAVDGDCADCMVGGDGEISGEEEHAMDRGCLLLLLRIG
ncbi:unnamed protein product [Symbiodinium necroappetens]|uniref:Uncharacterized protein n=1 Tax=Symbiodinium necroappetens TaxID=1628268 RepID=A0A812S7E3_9DINO|nr:unnamed protein product [Symbiodinium necroappetens]